MSAAWLDGKPHRATAEQVRAKWGSSPMGMGCSICGKRFAEGDTYRFVYMNGKTPSPGNFLVCADCDEPGLAERVRDALRRYKPYMEDWVLLYLLGEQMNGRTPPALRRMEESEQHD